MNAIFLGKNITQTVSRTKATLYNGNVIAREVL